MPRYRVSHLDALDRQNSRVVVAESVEAAMSQVPRATDAVHLHDGPAIPVSRTSDGVPVTHGLRVFTNDARWGEVSAVAAFAGDRPGDPWHEVTLDGEHSPRVYNGERLATRSPF